MRLGDAIQRAQSALAGGPSDIALLVLDDLEALKPVHVPEGPFASPDVRAMFRGDRPVVLEESQRLEYEGYADVVIARSIAIAENKRRLNNVLWAHEKLHAEKRPEASLMREFLREEWGYTGELPVGSDRRYALVHQLAPVALPRRRLTRPGLARAAPSNTNLWESEDEDLSERGDPTRRAR